MVEELKQALAASHDSVQVARNETEIQQEIAKDLRRKYGPNSRGASKQQTQLLCIAVILTLLYYS
jgi:hypothetical protein